MRLLKQSTARDIMVFMADSTDHVTGKTGLTLTITASKNAAAFASITPTVTERGDGWYKLALTSSHSDTLGDLALHITGTGADPADVLCQVVQYLPGENDAAIMAKTNLIGTATGELNAPLTNGSLLTLYKNGDYKLADNRAIRVTLPAGTYPDITGATCRLGVTKSKDNTGGFVVEASAQSGSAVADQTIDFELDHATETGDIEPAYAYGWTCRVVYPGVDPLTQWDNLDPISGKVKVLEDRVGNSAP
jgi:hypothetical protein